MGYYNGETLVCDDNSDDDQMDYSEKLVFDNSSDEDQTDEEMVDKNGMMMMLLLLLLLLFLLLLLLIVSFGSRWGWALVWDLGWDFCCGVEFL